LFVRDVPTDAAYWGIVYAVESTDPVFGPGGKILSRVPSINDTGDIAGVTSASSFYAPRALYFRSGASGDMSILVEEGAPAPGTGGGWFWRINDPILNSSGQVAFTAMIGSDYSGAFLLTDGVVDDVARRNDPAPGLAGGTFSSFGGSCGSSITVHDQGDVAFVARDIPGNQGLFVRDSGGSLSAIVLSGDPAPGGGTLAQLSIGPNSMNANGDIAFRAATTGIYVADSSGGVAAIARVGDSAPGTGGGTFSSFTPCSEPAINSTGDVVFTGDVTGGTTARGLFISSGGILSAIAIEGMVSDDIGYAQGFEVGGLTDTGTVAFEAYNGLYTACVCLFSDGALVVLTTGSQQRQGDPLGNSDDGTYGPITVADINASDHVIFYASFGSDIYITQPCPGDIDCDNFADGTVTLHVHTNTNQAIDNCIFSTNSNQKNTDGNFVDNSPPYAPATDDRTWISSDAVGDACDADDDNDLQKDYDERTPFAYWCDVVTDQLLRDTDGDLFADLRECQFGSDPTNPASVPNANLCGRGWDVDGDRIDAWVENCIYMSSDLSTDSDGDRFLDGASDGCEVASINADRIVNSGDQGMLALAISRVVPYTANVDITKDGTINSGDQGFVASYISPPGQCP
jgi:hypothetical protein